jgi:subtilisin family serine protease
MMGSDRSAKKTGLSAQNRFIVVFKDSVKHPRALAVQQATAVGGQVMLVYRSALEGYAATLSRKAVAALADKPTVDYITPDRKMTIEAVPTGVKRAGAPSNAKLDIDDKDDRRVDVDVAIIDTGIYDQHPDLNVVGKTDCVPGLVDEQPECIDGAGEDSNGHGTHVAGTVGARDGGELVGVAPGSRLWAVRVLNGNGEALESWVIAGVDWVTAHADQIEVANMSLGCGPLVDEELFQYKACAQPALDDAISASVEEGVVYVVAAGNAGVDAKYASPARNPDVITVSAVADYDGKPGGEADPTCIDYGDDDHLASFSNYGSEVEVAAPGVCIWSTYPPLMGMEYEQLSGTSMAAPHIAGTAAVLASKENPDSREDVEAIRATIVENGDQSWEDEEREPILKVTDETAFAPAWAGSMATKPPSGSSFSGVINPMGLTTTHYFEYGTTTSYGSSTAPVNAGSGDEFVSVSKKVTGLKTDGTVYHYRLVATNSSGTLYGGDQTLSISPPQAETGAASEVKGWGARLHGTVDPRGRVTKVYFEIGRTTSYDQVTLGSAKTLTATSGNTSTSQWFDGFEPGTTYHYRVVADNGFGKTFGADQSFTIPPSLWEAESVPSKGAGTRSGFSGVSCGSAQDCMAVGQSSEGIYPKSTTSAFAQRWDGVEWTFVPWPDFDEAFPAYKDDILRRETVGVECTSPDWCVALGQVSLKEGAGSRGYVNEWDGEQWTTNIVASELIDHPEVILHGVTCLSESMCFISGQYVDEETVFPISLKWDGETWTSVEVPLPAGGDWGWLRSVSCQSAMSCIAFGGYARVEPILVRDTAWQWNGEAWSVIATEYPYTFFRVGRDASCFDAGVFGCWAPASGARGVNYFDGSKWGPNATIEGLDFAIPTLVSDVSCGSGLGAPCVAAGIDRIQWSTLNEPPLIGNHRSVLAIWDGSKWTRQAVEGTPPGTGQDRSNSLYSVDCIDGWTCTAVGNYFDSVSGSYQPFAVRFEVEPPTVKTEAASSITSVSAKLNGNVDPNGRPSTYQFEYGTTTAYGSKAPASSKSVGSGSEAVSVSETIESFEPGTEYHYRLVAYGEFGPIYGQDKVFTTPTPHWSQEGAALPAEATITAEGPLKLSTGSASIECTSKATMTLIPGSTGKVTQFTPALAGCTFTGWMKEVKCSLTSTSAGSLPWPVNVTEKAGVRTIKVEKTSFTYKLAGTFCPELTVTGTLSANADKDGEIAALTLSGTLSSSSGSMTASGTLAVKPAGKYGVTIAPGVHWSQEGAALPAEATITAEGPLKITNGSTSIQCSVKAKATLTPASSAQVSEFTPNTGTCALTGFYKEFKCTVTSITPNSLPWAAAATEKAGVRSIVVEKASLTYKFSGSPFCGEFTTTGTLAATPDKAAEMSNLSISGGLSGLWSASGTLALTPAGKYGMQ